MQVSYSLYRYRYAYTVNQVVDLYYSVSIIHLVEFEFEITDNFGSVSDTVTGPYVTRSKLLAFRESRFKMCPRPSCSLRSLQHH